MSERGHKRTSCDVRDRSALPSITDIAGILQTASALEAVFKSVDVDGAWMAV
jgi:hypothetical protein